MKRRAEHQQQREQETLHFEDISDSEDIDEKLDNDIDSIVKRIKTNVDTPTPTSTIDTTTNIDIVLRSESEQLDNIEPSVNKQLPLPPPASKSTANNSNTDRKDRESPISSLDEGIEDMEDIDADTKVSLPREENAAKGSQFRSIKTEIPKKEAFILCFPKGPNT